MAELTQAERLDRLEAMFKDVVTQMQEALKLAHDAAAHHEKRIDDLEIALSVLKRRLFDD